jgi:hypothetical protein
MSAKLAGSTASRKSYWLVKSTDAGLLIGTLGCNVRKIEIESKASITIEKKDTNQLYRSCCIEGNDFAITSAVNLLNSILKVVTNKDSSTSFIFKN